MTDDAMPMFQTFEFSMPSPAPELRAVPDDCLVAARNDVELAGAFLELKVLAPATRKSIVTELSRFLWWLDDRQLYLQQMSVDSMKAYREFLLDPQPREKWVSAPLIKEGEPGYDPKKPGIRWPRNDPRWRPFCGPLSTASAGQAFRVARELLAFARNTGYIRLDAAALVASHTVKKVNRGDRYLGKDNIDYIDALLGSMLQDNRLQRRAAARDRFLFLAFVTTGARLSQIAKASMGAIEQDSADGSWWLVVTDKDDNPRHLPVCDELLDAFRTYRLAFGLGAAPRSDPVRYPLVLSLRRHEPVGVSIQATAKAIGALLDNAAELAKMKLDMVAYAALKEASTHWLRHEMIWGPVNHTGAVLQDGTTQARNRCDNKRPIPFGAQKTPQ
jgi:integrase/recombinase XerD